MLNIPRMIGTASTILFVGGGARLRRGSRPSGKSIRLLRDAKKPCPAQRFPLGFGVLRNSVARLAQW